MLQYHWHGRPEHGSPGVQHYRGQSYRSVLRQRGLLRPDAFQPYQFPQSADAVRDLPYFLRDPHWVLMNARLQLPTVPGYGRPRGILPVWK